MIKKIFTAALALFIFGAFGCRPKEEKKPETGEGLSILCSFLPLWVFTVNVVGGRPGVEVDVLIPGHQGPHDYQLTPADMQKIEGANLFIANGYHLEEFLTDSLREARPDMRVLMAAETVKPIMIGDDGAAVIHLEAEEGHDEDEASGHHHDHGVGGVDPHVFASPRDAAKMVNAIALELIRLDPEGEPTYRANAEAYMKKLEALADEFKAVVSGAKSAKVVTFHNSLNYLARDCGLEVVGVIESSPGQQPSAGELAALARTIREQGAVAVLGEPQFSDALARVLAEESGARLSSLDPGATGDMTPEAYEKTMKANLATLRKILPPESP